MIFAYNTYKVLYWPAISPRLIVRTVSLALAETAGMSRGLSDDGHSTRT